jgi:hypothetical protein
MTSPQPSYWLDLINYIRSSLTHIKDFIHLAQGKFVDKRFGEYFCRGISSDVEKLDVLLKELLAYIKIITPIEKKDTVQMLIEEVSETFKSQLEEKGITLFKNFEKDLPKTGVSEEHLRHILRTLLRYGVTCVSSVERVGLLTKTVVVPVERKEGMPAPSSKEEKLVEILLVFSQKSPESCAEVPMLGKEGPSNLILRLVEELVLMNRGTIAFESDEKKASLLISLRVPPERRKTVYYKATDE